MIVGGVRDCKSLRLVDVATRDTQIVAARRSDRSARDSRGGLRPEGRGAKRGIRAFIDRHNEDPKPFKWTKSADDILAAVKRFCLRVEQNLWGL